MATLRNEILVRVPAALAWANLRDISKTHELFAGVLTDGRVEGDVRVVTFANGVVVRERIVAIDESRMRVAYTMLGDRFEHYAASMRIAPVNGAECRFVWTIDFLPDHNGERVAPLMAAGCEALKRVLEASHAEVIVHD